MYQVPAETLNQIAESETMATEWGEALFRLNQAALLKSLETQAEKLARAGVADAVIVPYQKIAPVLAEQKAIASFIRKTGNLELTGALPAVETPDEAVMVMTQEHRLSPRHAGMLFDMLQKLPAN